MKLGRRELLWIPLSLPAASLLDRRTIAKAPTRALVPEQPIERIAFGSCAMRWMEQPIWQAVAASRPDLFLFLGDAIYGDYDGEKVFTPTEEILLRDWGELAAQPGFEFLREQVPVMATWGNHDYGSHDGGAEIAHEAMSKKIVLDFFEEPEDSARRRCDGVYDARIFGAEGRRVQVILFDNGWNRGALVPDTRSKEERKALEISGSMGHTPTKTPR